jgi:hypothetical protein
MDFKHDLEKIINEESMAQKTRRANALKARITSLKASGRDICDKGPAELRGECYQKVTNQIKKAELALYNLSHS